MAETAKKAKKKKGKTLALTEFLAKDGENGSSAVAHAAIFSARSTSWADESENLSTEVDTAWPEEAYGGISTDNKLRAAMDRASLPTAPRASRGPDIDVSKVPDGPPYTAFLGNLSYDVDRDDIFDFFAGKKITEVRLPQDSNGRLKGFGYAEFEDKQSLLAALSLNNEHLKNRRIRVDVAGQQQQQERERGDRDRNNEPDRTDSDWRSKPDPPPTQNGNNDRYNDDGGSRDRWGPRGDDGGPRDRSGYRGYDDGPSWDRSGGRERGYDDGPRGYQERRGDDRYGDRDRGKGFGSNWDSGDRDRRDDRGQDRYDSGRDRPDDRRYGDRYGGDRDRGGGYGRDRYDDRRGGDRYGGYGRDRYDDRRGGDRYDDRRGGDRYDDRRGGDRFDDRRGGDRYGDRDRRRDYDDRERSSWRDSDRGRDSRSDFDRDEREPVRERPRLQLQPRTKPVEETKGETAADNSVFGGAKPVDTAAKEREIEEKLARQKLEDEAKLKQEKERQRERRERDEWPRGSSGRARRDSNRSSDGERGGKDRRDNPDFRSRRDSARSSDEGTPSKDAEPTSRENSQGGGKEVKAAVKEAPKDAPPPAVNVWAQRMEQQKAASTGTVEPKSPTGEHRVEINVDSSTMTVTSPTSPTSSDRKGFPSKPPGPRKDFREGGGPPKGRGRGTRPERGERSDRTDRGDRASVNGPDGGGRGVRKEKRERRPVEPKKYEEAQQPVFHMKSKFAALLDDEEQSEQDTQEQLDVDDET
ncbi:eukaryotic translation initiation factor 4B-like [Stylophora pistillata]|nr:eukaryotic translation initiation factor 4B-like [Stylophora pistillata]